MDPFDVDSQRARRQWRRFLLALEQRIVLSRAYPGMIADDLSDYMFFRTGGHIGSVMTLVVRGIQRAVRSGAGRLDEALLDQVTIDAAAEKARKALETKFRRGRATSKPKPAKKKNPPDNGKNGPPS
jgi:hypothetical protein